MAPKKPAKTLKQLSGIKTQAVDAKTIPQAAPAGEGCGTGNCGCSNGGTCAGCDGRCTCKTWLGCHFLGVMKQKKAIAGWVGAMLILVASQIVVHGHLLMPAYGASSALWLPEDAMRIDLIYIFNAALALVLVMLFYVAQKFGDYVEGVRLGMMLMMPLALLQLVTAATQPVPSDILWVWSIEYLVQGALIGALLTALGRCSCCAGKWIGGCGKSHQHSHHHHHNHKH